MSDPIINYELSKMQHREYEAQVSRCWGQNETNGDTPALSKGHKLLLALVGIGLMTMLIVMM